MTEILTAYITLPSQEVGLTLSQALLEKKLIACGNLFSPHQAIYRWEGSMKTETEWALLVKTQISKQQALEAAIMELHPYEVPCILYRKVEASSSFAQWVVEETS